VAPCSLGTAEDEETMLWAEVAGAGTEKPTSGTEELAAFPF